MLKIKKGIKKKKGKKDKEEDLFDPENLAKFKKELEERKAESGEGTSGGIGPTTNDSKDSARTPTVDPGADDEWARFKQLTAGIDVTLKKTSGDLDRIKTTSYYQKKVSAAVVEEKKVQWENVEKEDFHQDHNKPFSPSTDEVDACWDAALPIAVEARPEELKFEAVEKEIVVLDDGLFDTSYLDAIESGEIQLAYIPDSPVEPDDGDDPFDTSAVADVVKKIQEQEVKEKRKVNLGCAVEVLTKKVDAPLPKFVPYEDKTEEIKRTKRGRPVYVDLLGFDGTDDSSVQPQSVPATKPAEKSDPTALDFSEFESNASILPQGHVSNLDLLTQPEVEEIVELAVDDDDAWFRTDDTDATVPSKAEPIGEKAEAEVDPFDTSVVEKLGFGKSELRQLEDELLNSESDKPASAAPGHSISGTKTLTEQKILTPPEPASLLTKAETLHDFDFDPRKDEPLPPSFHPLDIVHPDSTFDITALTPLNLEEEEIDPFDTSAVSHIAIPGKSELRLLEDEFISPHQLEKSAQFLEFSTGTQISSAPAPVQPPPEYHPLDAPDDCINEILELQHPPLKSQPTLPYSVTKEFDDPFDTSDVVDTFAPGKNELKELESELLNSTVDFVPPRICPLKNFKVLQNTSITSIVSTEQRQQTLHPFDSVDGDLAEVEHHRPLSPQAAGHSSFEDPFDTSAVTGILPGKVEAKLLEEELASAHYQPIVRQTTLERTHNTFSLPPNIPVAAPSPIPDFEEVDPFDTSIADSVVP